MSSGLPLSRGNVMSASNPDFSLFFESPPPAPPKAAKIPQDPSAFLIPFAARRVGFLREWELLRPLGDVRGSVRLWLGVRLGGGGGLAAVKIVRKRLLRSVAAGTALAREIELHALATGAPHVIPLLEAWEESGGEEEGCGEGLWAGGNDTGPYVALVLPFYEKGDLGSFLRARVETRAPPGEARLILRQLLQAVAALAKRGIVHGDINPANVLILSTSQGRGGAHEVSDISLCDFGASRYSTSSPPPPSESSESSDFYGVYGTLGFIAPEIFRQQPSTGLPSDVWSIGCLFYELQAGYAPFMPYRLPLEATWPLPWPQPAATGIDDASGDAGQWLSVNARDLAARMLDTDPARRITAAEALDHAYFYEIDTPRRDMSRSSSIYE